MTDPADSASTTDHPTVFRAARPGATRRTVLRAAGLVALVGGGSAALAACSDDSATPTTAEPSAAASSAASSPSEAESSSAAPSASASSKAPSGPSVTKADVPEGSGVIMQDADYVVTQPEKGTYKAFSKICTHQGCPVAMITNKEIVCNCHGSHFSITDGSVISGPASKPLPEAKTTVSGDNIVISA